MRTETSEPRGKDIRKDEPVWKHMGCNGKIPIRVQGRAYGIHQLDISCGESLEVIGNDHPRYIAAEAARQNKIRLNSVAMGRSVSSAFSFSM